MNHIVNRLVERLNTDLDTPSPAVKQSATAVAVVIASVIALAVPGIGFSDSSIAVTGIVIVALATLLSLIFTKVPNVERFVMIIPAIDLIDFDYPAWHTADDTLERLSAESLQKVGSVTVHFLKTALGK